MRLGLRRQGYSSHFLVFILTFLIERHFFQDHNNMECQAIMPRPVDGNNTRGSASRHLETKSVGIPHVKQECVAFPNQEPLSKSSFSSDSLRQNGKEQCFGRPLVPGHKIPHRRACIFIHFIFCCPSIYPSVFSRSARKLGLAADISAAYCSTLLCVFFCILLQ